eukprot:gb/GFBE01043793.1/.p1 GENE.gb/GFBE01043793.1/~~gb/GFBE01043793.1/.p1  ORF type:complete len:474 (+),score=108.42 gb/GFBE01043793.1/:1-1422(+)
MAFLHSSLRAAVLLGGAMAAVDEAACGIPGAQSQCRQEVMKAKQNGVADNDSLNAESSFEDIQSYFWQSGKYGCLRPCGLQEEACVKVGDSNPCQKDVQWAATVGIPSHPAWYPGLSEGASSVKIAEFLYRNGQPNCPRPCGEDEDEGHFVPYSQGSTPEPTTSTPKVTKPPTTTWDFQAEINKGVPYSVAHAEWKARLEKSEVERLKKLLQHMGKPTESPSQPKQEDDCAKPGITYESLDMYGAMAKLVSGPIECHMHCRRVDGAAYFHYYQPVGLCNCVPLGTGEEKTPDQNSFGGSVLCGKGSWEEVNKATAQIVKKMSDDCFEADKSYAPVFGEPLPVYVESALACQKELQTSNLEDAEYFSYVSFTGACRILPSGAKTINATGAVSGPRHCGDNETVIAVRKFEQGAAVEKHLQAAGIGQKLQVATGILAVALVSSTVFFAVRRYSGASRSHHLLSNGDVEEGTCQVE